MTGGVPGDFSLRVTVAAAAVDAAERARDLDGLGAGGSPCSGVLRHASHLQCSPQFTPACYTQLPSSFASFSLALLFKGRKKTCALQV